MSLHRRSTNDTTELAKERNRQAAERTLTSWIQNSLGLIGFGAAFQSIFNALNQSFPQNSPVINMQIAYAVGLSAIGLGIFLLIPVIIPYRNYIKSLEQDNFLHRPPRLFDLKLLLVSVTLYGVIALIAVLLISEGQ
jgi:putative membrane protein